MHEIINWLNYRGTKKSPTAPPARPLKSPIHAAALAVHSTKSPPPRPYLRRGVASGQRAYKAFPIVWSITHLYMLIIRGIDK